MSKELKPTKGTPSPGAIAEKSEKPKRELPRVTFTAEDIPEIKNWKIGGKYYLKLEVEEVAAEKDRYGFEGEKEKPLTATFKVLAVRVMDHLPEHDDDDHKEEMFPKGYKGNPNRL
jgi:predicted RNA-binding protein YlxR (DUF448 family)